MADDADLTQEMIERVEGDTSTHLHKIAEAIPKGTPGLCEYCGEFFERTVQKACGRCRDTFKLK